MGFTFIKHSQREIIKKSDLGGRMHAEGRSRRIVIPGQPDYVVKVV